MRLLAVLLHAAALAAAAPLLDGLLRRAAARRHGGALPPLLQPAHDLRRLWRKPGLVPHGASAVFAGAPAVSFGAAATAALATPSFAADTPIGGSTDLLVVAGLLALSRAAPALAAFDTGSARDAFEGDRIVAARLSAAPVLLLAALVVAVLTGGTDPGAGPLRGSGVAPGIPGLLAGLALLGWAAADRPAPAIFSGRHLALSDAAFQLRRVAALSLAATAGLPFGMAGSGSGPDAWLVGACCWALKLGVLGLLAAAAGTHGAVLPAAALLTLIGAVVVGVQGRA